ncbi:probable pectinesterase 8 [Vigna unguiculata]|uniref:Pectinesterase n=1 Tax=Vigna unguiculata TaxID=3917 RepID=A0A4D6M894_VIGUN|nr:probable pectinesterase 8 [Vigna unguiculata]QCD97495.1 pectinesterase [Vigna unguiculata]
MGPQSNLLSLLVALAALFSSLYLINPIPKFFINPIPQYLINVLSPSSAYFAKPLTGNFQRHHKKHPDSGNTESICDDFPPGIPPPNTNTTSYLCVDRKGCCNFTTVQAAVNAVPDFSVKRTILWINSGMYYEKVMVPKTKPNITFQGQGYTSTAIAWNDTALSANGTFYSGSVQVFASNFIAKNISFMNLAPMPSPGAVGAQAVAIRVSGDQSEFRGCGFFGAQDTLHDDKGRHYFKDCYIQGSIDFIFGNARSLYENCEIVSIANPVPVGQRSINGAVTAHGRVSGDENTGFAFVNSTVGGNGRIWLGRAWRPYSRVVFAFTSMSDIIAPEGWNDFNDPSRDQTIFYGEYNCSGSGANTNLRAAYVQKLNETQASAFLNISFIDGEQWLETSK